MENKARKAAAYFPNDFKTHEESEEEESEEEESEEEESEESEEDRMCSCSKQEKTIEEMDKGSVSIHRNE